MGGRTLNPDSTAGDIDARWQTSTLRSSSSTTDRRSAAKAPTWASTVWHEVHPNGYLGAMAEHGFACPLLAQISDELRSTVFGRVVDALR
jgi:hypothetical protein